MMMVMVMVMVMVMEAWRSLAAFLAVFAFLFSGGRRWR